MGHLGTVWMYYYKAPQNKWSWTKYTDHCCVPSINWPVKTGQPRCWLAAAWLLTASWICWIMHNISIPTRGFTHQGTLKIIQWGGGLHGGGLHFVFSRCRESGSHLMTPEWFNSQKWMIKIDRGCNIIKLRYLRWIRDEHLSNCFPASAPPLKISQITTVVLWTSFCPHSFPSWFSQT